MTTSPRSEDKGSPEEHRKRRHPLRWVAGLLGALVLVIWLSQPVAPPADSPYVTALKARGVSPAGIQKADTQDPKSWTFACETFRSGDGTTLAYQESLVTSVKYTASDAPRVLAAAIATYCPDVPLS